MCLRAIVAKIQSSCMLVETLEAVSDKATMSFKCFLPDNNELKIEIKSVKINKNPAERYIYQSLESPAKFK